MIALAFLQFQRLQKAKGGEKNRRTTTETELASNTPGHSLCTRATAPFTLPALP